MRSTDDIPPAEASEDYDPAAPVETQGGATDPAQSEPDGEHPDAGELIDPDEAEREAAQTAEEAQD